MRLVLHIVSFWISVWSTQAQDVMSPTVDILTELGKIRTMEEKLKAMEDEIKELRKENKEQAMALDVCRASTDEMNAKLDKLAQVNKDHKVAFSAFLLDTTTPTNVGPFSTATTLIYKYVFTNVGEAYNSATGIFTAPLKGVYVFRIFSKAVGRSGHSVTAGLFKNGNHVMSTHADQANGFYSTSNGVTLQLEKGDTLYVRLYPYGWIFDNGEHHHSSFSGHLLFPL